MVQPSATGIEPVKEVGLAQSAVMQGRSHENGRHAGFPQRGQFRASRKPPAHAHLNARASLDEAKDEGGSTDALAGPHAGRVEEQEAPGAGVHRRVDQVQRVGRPPRRAGREDRTAGPEVEAENDRARRGVPAEVVEQGGAGQGLGGRDDRPGPGRNEVREPGKVSEPGIDPDVKTEVRGRAEKQDVGWPAFDRIQVGDVQVVEAEGVAEVDRQADWVGPRSENAPDRPVFAATAAPGVDGLAGPQVDDGDDAKAQKAGSPPVRPCKVLVHEWVTGGGLAGRELPESWAVEGRAMRQAVAADFQCVPGVDVVVTTEARFPQVDPPWRSAPVAAGREESVLSRLSRSCDYTVLIAPETGGVLESRAALIERSGGKSLGSTPEAIALAADKWRLAEHFARHGVASPRTEQVGDATNFPPDLPYPIVVKPNDGAGALHTYYLDGPGDDPFDRPLPGGMIAQPYCPGEPLSATFLVGPSGSIRLVGVGWQRLDVRSGAVHYRGGRLPAPPDFARGAPLAAVRAIPGLRGVVGVDFVRDVSTGTTTVIEVNPRPTTSYVGLTRGLPRGAIARAWLALFLGPATADDLRGMIVPDLRPEILFAADGEISEPDRGGR